MSFGEVVRNLPPEVRERIFLEEIQKRERTEVMALLSERLRDHPVRHEEEGKPRRRLRLPEAPLTTAQAVLIGAVTGGIAGALASLPWT